MPSAHSPVEVIAFGNPRITASAPTTHATSAIDRSDDPAGQSIVSNETKLLDRKVVHVRAQRSTGSPDSSPTWEHA